MADPTIPAGLPVRAASPGPPAVRPAGWRPQGAGPDGGRDGRDGASARRNGRRTGMATGTGEGRRGWERSTCVSPRCATGPTSRACWSPPTEREGLAGSDSASLRGRGQHVDELLHIVPMSLREALGLTGIDTPALAGGARESRVSRICKELDEVVEPFRNRPLERQYPFVWLDALYLKVWHNHRIASQALVIATGVRESGEREVLGFALGASEGHHFPARPLSERAIPSLGIHHNHRVVVRQPSQRQRLERYALARSRAPDQGLRGARSVSSAQSVQRQRGLRSQCIVLGLEKCVQMPGRLEARRPRRGAERR